MSARPFFHPIAAILAVTSLAILNAQEAAKPKPPPAKAAKSEAPKPKPPTSLQPLSFQPGQAGRATLRDLEEIADFVSFSVSGNGKATIRIDVINADGTPGGKCSENTCYLSISVDPAVLPGTYPVQGKKKDGTEKPTGVELVIAALAREGYVHCPHLAQPLGVNRRLNANGPGVQCQAGLMDPKEAADIFGTRIAKTYLVFQVRVENQREDFEYFLRSMRLTVNGRDGKPSISVPTRDRGLARGVAIKGQTLDPRNLTLSIVRAAGSVYGGIAAMPIDSVLAGKVAGLFNGPMLDSVSRALPDFTVQQVSRVDDYTLSRSGVVIPRRAPETLIALLPIRVFLRPEERDLIMKTKLRRKLDEGTDTSVYRCKKLECKDLAWLHHLINIEVSGSHVAELNLTEPKLQRVTPAEIERGAAPVSLTLFGTELQKVAALEITGTNADAPVQVRISGKADDHTFATAVLDKSTLDSLTGNEYSLALIGTDGGRYPSPVILKIKDASKAEPALLEGSIPLGKPGKLVIESPGRVLNAIRVIDTGKFRLKFGKIQRGKSATAYAVDVTFDKDCEEGTATLELTFADGSKSNVDLTIDPLPKLTKFTDSNGNTLTEVKRNADTEVELNFSDPVDIDGIKFVAGDKTVTPSDTRIFASKTLVRVKVKLTEPAYRVEVTLHDRPGYVVKSAVELKTKAAQ